eukprot:403373795
MEANIQNQEKENIQNSYNPQDYEPTPVAIDANGREQYYPDVEQLSLQIKYNQNFNDQNNQVPQYVQAQPAQTQGSLMPNLLRQLLDSDPFNMYCVDCKVNLSDHASLNFGIFICYACASIHHKELGQDVSYIMSLYSDPWDEYQGKFMQIGGNKNFYNFIKTYELENEAIKQKYTHRASVYYCKKLRAKIDGQDFDYKPPPKEEWKVITQNVAGKIQYGMVASTEWVKEQYEKSGIGGKIKNFLNGN